VNILKRETSDVKERACHPERSEGSATHIFFLVIPIRLRRTRQGI